MYRDKSLLPTQVIRLAALGSLALGPKRYGDLAAESRAFTASVVGPSLDLLGTSLELLRFEGLVEAVDGEGMADNAEMRLTEAGRTVLHELLTAPMKQPVNDISKLIVFLKLRFLHLLPADEQSAQADLLVDMAEGELARLEELKRRHGGEPGCFASWLDLDLEQTRARLDWFRRLKA